MKKTEKHFCQSYNDSDTSLAMRVSIVSIIVNIILSLLKLIAGLIGKSGAMISDAIHSASDVFSTFIVMIGITFSKKKSDKEHPYGHERMECVAAVVLSAVLATTGLGIGMKGIKTIVDGTVSEVKTHEMVALVASVISVIVKESMFWYTKITASKIKSGALMADAWHHRSDALSSVGAFAGILGSMLGFPVFDSIASVIICIFIVKAAIDIFKDAVDRMVDRSCPDDIIEKMRHSILEVGGVYGIDDFKSRLFGSRIYVEVEILVDGRKNLFEAHEIADRVHKIIEEKFPDVKHCMVHVNPK